MITMGIIMVALGILVAAFLAVPLQGKVTKPVTGACGTLPAGSSCVVMPSGAGSDQLNFSPGNLTVVLGVNSTVVWSNVDSVAHTVKSSTVPSGAAGFSSAIINPGETYTVTLTVAGTYHYYCTIHPGWMQANIIVKQG